MKTTRMKRNVYATAIALVLGMTVHGAASAQPLPAPKPGDEQPRVDLLRQAKPVAPRPAAGATRSGPGTQTEDDLYIGRKVGGTNTTPGERATAPQIAPGNALVRPVQPITMPGSAAPQPKPGQRARSTGDEDPMDDLDVQRRKAQGLADNKPSTFTPKTQPGGEQPRGERRQ